MTSPKEPLFQLHLATCIVMMFTASLLMGFYAPQLQTFADTFGPEYPRYQVWPTRVLTVFLGIPGLIVVAGVAWACEWWIRWRAELDRKLAAAAGLAQRASDVHRQLLTVLAPARGPRPAPEAGQPAPATAPGARLHWPTALVLTLATMALAAVSLHPTPPLEIEGAQTQIQTRGWPLPWYKDYITPYGVVLGPSKQVVWKARDWYPLQIVLDGAGYLVVLASVAALSEWLIRRKRAGLKPDEPSDGEPRE